MAIACGCASSLRASARPGFPETVRVWESCPVYGGLSSLAVEGTEVIAEAPLVGTAARGR